MSDTKQDTNDDAAQAAKDANAAELAKWEGDFDPESLKVNYSREDQTEEEVEKPEIKDETEQEEEAEEYTEPVPVITVDDPGEFKPQDYSFEIEIDGKTVKVESVEQAEKLADENADNLNAKQIISLMSKATKMELKSERDKDDYDRRKAEFDKQYTSQAERQETVANLAKELDYLVTTGKMPEISADLKNANWEDPQVAKQPGVKEQIALVSYMTKENAKREKAGVKPLTSMLDAFNAWQMDEGVKQAAEASKAAGEARKAAGARVAASTSSNVGAYVPKGIAVGNPNILKRNTAVWDN